MKLPDWIWFSKFTGNYVTRSRCPKCDIYDCEHQKCVKCGERDCIEYFGGCPA